MRILIVTVCNPEAGVGLYFCNTKTLPPQSRNYLEHLALSSTSETYVEGDLEEPESLAGDLVDIRPPRFPLV